MQVGFDPKLGSAQPGAAQQEAGVLGKEEFLKLLVAQLSHQDPLNPAEDTEFIAQLAQFSSLEQLMGIGDGVSDLTMVQASANSADTVGFIGKDVMASAQAFEVGIGPAPTVAFNSPQGAASVTVQVMDSNGQIVWDSTKAPVGSGITETDFAGLDEDGRPLLDGSYTIKAEATDADGNPLPIETLVGARVDGVTFERGLPELQLAGGLVGLSDVRRVGDGA